MDYHPSLAHVVIWCEKCHTHYCAGCYVSCPNCETAEIIKLNSELEARLEESNLWGDLSPAEKEDIIKMMKTS